MERRQRTRIAVAIVVIALVFVGGRALWRGRDAGSGSPASSGSAADGSAASDDPWSGAHRPIHVTPTGERDPGELLVGPAVVEGTVRDATSHQPVAGATVAFWNKKGEQTTESDASGHYELQLTVGVWSCAATDGTDADARVASPRKVTLGSTNPPVDLELVRLAHVHGLVRDAAGRAVADAVVTYEHADPVVREALDASIGRTATAGADGSYRLAVLPGEVRLRADAPHQLAHKAIPGVAAGADVQADLTMQAQVSIDGRVVDPKGAPIDGAKVEAFVAVLDVDLNAKKTMETGADGRFEFSGLNPGWLTLSARTDDGALAGHPQVDLSQGDAHDLVLTVPPPATGHGRVTYGDGSPARRATIRVVFAGYAGRWAETSTDDDGRFEYHGPGYGSYDVTATTEQGTGLAEGVSPSKPVEIVIHAPGGIRGFVHTGTTAATSIAIAVERFTPAESAQAQFTPPPGQTFLSADGRFEWAHLAPGAYDLAVHVPGAASAHVHAAVTDAAWTELDIALEAGAGVHGRVHAGDRPVANARVDVPCTRGSEVSGADGAFALTDLPAAGCDVTITADGYKVAQRTAHPGEALDVALEPAGPP